MKVRFHPVVLSVTLALLSSATALAEGATPSQQVFVDPDDPGAAGVRMLGERTIDQVGNSMILEVRRVLAQTSPALAIGVMHLKDYKLPAATPGQPVVTEVRRTSLRVRNPANAPDAADLAALQKIQEQLEYGDPVSKVLVQLVSTPGQPMEWRVYRPLAVLKQCVDCHGAENKLAPGVADTLKVFYPADKAVNYKEGSWRGLIRVSITDSAKGK